MGSVITWLFLIGLIGCQSLPHDSLHPPLGPKTWKKLYRDPETAGGFLNPPTPLKQSKDPSVQQAIVLDKKWYTPISLYTTPTLPIIKVFKQTAQDLGLTLEFSQTEPTYGLDLSINDQPFFHAIQTLCRLSQWRYEATHHKTIVITPDAPYQHSYEVQFLNLLRQSHSSTSSNGDLGAGNQANISSPGSGVNFSTSQISTQTSSDFWQELKDNLTILLEGYKFTIHKQGGLITVIAPHSSHKEVAIYLARLKKIATTQVLIEAKMVEVHLKEEFKSGINWQTIGKDKNFFVQSSFASTTHPTTLGSSPLEVMTIGGRKHNFQAIMQSLESFGSVRTLSSPRLSVMNNQNAILKVAKNQVYFKLSYDKHYGNLTSNESINVTSTIQTVPIGLVLNVQPAVDFDKGEVILFLRPTISRLSSSVADPAVEIALAGQNGQGSMPHPQSLVPIVEVREIESVLRLYHDDLAIVGGLMEIQSQDHRHHVPGTSNIPGLRDLTGAKATHDSVVELVILLKATIIDHEQSPRIDNADRQLMTKLVHDPRKK